jgi:hypothetical protein
MLSCTRCASLHRLTPHSKPLLHGCHCNKGLTLLCCAAGHPERQKAEAVSAGFTWCIRPVPKLPKAMPVGSLHVIETHTRGLKGHRATERTLMSRRANG